MSSFPKPINYIDDGYESGIIALTPRGTNSTLFTQCCSVAICDDQAFCPRCHRPVIGSGLSRNERHKKRWDNATRNWQKPRKDTDQ